ncbi:hypothetical protein HanIR_Chr02g0070311 [Helianthus annuus]|nr:hypothetical protein HanIR_Chr02g0070311 [Helianthus annuus]
MRWLTHRKQAEVGLKKKTWPYGSSTILRSDWICFERWRWGDLGGGGPWGSQG